MTGTLDSGGKLSLVSGAVAGDSSRKNLRSVRDILMKFGCVLVIYALNLIDAESANLLAALAVGSSVVFSYAMMLTSSLAKVEAESRFTARGYSFGVRRRVQVFSEREIVAYRDLLKIVRSACGEGRCGLNARGLLVLAGTRAGLCL